MHSQLSIIGTTYHLTTTSLSSEFPSLFVNAVCGMLAHLKNIVKSNPRRDRRKQELFSEEALTWNVSASRLLLPVTTTRVSRLGNGALLNTQNYNNHESMTFECHNSASWGAQTSKKLLAVK